DLGRNLLRPHDGLDHDRGQQLAFLGALDHLCAAERVESIAACRHVVVRRQTVALRGIERRTGDGDGAYAGSDRRARVVRERKSRDLQEATLALRQAREAALEARLEICTADL